MKLWTLPFRYTLRPFTHPRTEAELIAMIKPGYTNREITDGCGLISRVCIDHEAVFKLFKQMVNP